MIDLALIGSGYWGSKIVESLKKNSNVNKVQVVDVKNGQTIDDIDPGITTAIIATPLWDHYETTRELLVRGFDCYVEKPLAENTKQIADIWDCVNDQIVMVGHIFIYHPALQYVKDNLHSIGTVKHIRSERLNWGIYQTKTTPLLSLLPHDVSILLDLLGDLTVVSATQKNFTDNLVPDLVSFDVRAGDVTATVTGSWYWPERVRKLTVIGSEGHIVWDDAKNTVDIYLGTVQDRRLTGLFMPGTTHIPDLTVSPLESELNHFIDCVINRSQPRTDINNAFAVAKVLDDVQERLDQDYRNRCI
jgi:predicted dehydrogenase